MLLWYSTKGRFSFLFLSKIQLQCINFSPTLVHHTKRPLLFSSTSYCTTTSSLLFSLTLRPKVIITFHSQDHKLTGCLMSLPNKKSTCETTASRQCFLVKLLSWGLLFCRIKIADVDEESRSTPKLERTSHMFAD